MHMLLRLLRCLVSLFLVPAGYVDVPPSLPEERNQLVDLFGLCLAGGAALHARLVDALFDLSAVEAECRGVGTAASLGPEQPPLANVIAEAICGIKVQVQSVQANICMVMGFVWLSSWLVTKQP